MSLFKMPKGTNIAILKCPFQLKVGFHNPDSLCNCEEIKEKREKSRKDFLFKWAWQVGALGGLAVGLIVGLIL